MSQSSLVEYRDYSAKHWNGRAGNGIKRIVIHHCAGVLTLEQISRVFKNRNSSATYAIDKDGRIGQYVPEEYRPWTTSGWEPDRNCITIEVSNSRDDLNTWPVSDYVYSRLLDLLTDICRRNHITLNYTGNKTGNLLMHKWYASTACPGPYLADRFSEIAQTVNSRLQQNAGSKQQTAAVTVSQIDRLAKEVIAGKWDNGSARRQKLTAAGYDYQTVQARVNEIIAGNKLKTSKKTNQQIAAEVIAGKWGNGSYRKQALHAAGYNYTAIQKIVNEMMRK